MHHCFQLANRDRTKKFIILVPGDAEDAHQAEAAGVDAECDEAEREQDASGPEESLVFPEEDPECLAPAQDAKRACQGSVPLHQDQGVSH